MRCLGLYQGRKSVGLRAAKSHIRDSSFKSGCRSGKLVRLLRSKRTLRRNRARRLVSVGSALATTTVGLLCAVAPGVSHAAEPQGPELRNTVTAAPTPDLTESLRPDDGLVVRYGRELRWTQLALGDELVLQPRSPDAFSLRAELTRLDIRDSQWASTPNAATTVASAVISKLTRGITVFNETRDWKVVRRHRIAGYFRLRGGGLMWRVEF